MGAAAAATAAACDDDDEIKPSSILFCLAVPSEPGSHSKLGAHTHAYYGPRGRKHIQRVCVTSLSAMKCPALGARFTRSSVFRLGY